MMKFINVNGKKIEILSKVFSLFIGLYSLFILISYSITDAPLPHGFIGMSTVVTFRTP